MLINNKSVKGIFEYSPDLTYEPSDFVIENNGLFVCLQKSTGNLPSQSLDYFKPYLSDKCISLQEYLEEVDNPTEGEDKYISASTLSAVLNYYMSGFSKKGEITNSVEVTSDGTYTINGDISNPLRNSDEVLDYIINSESLNNAVFKISPEVFNGTHPRILRQYTYTEGTTKYRLQELIDLDSGGVEYRVGNSEIIGNWKSISDHDTINREISELKTYYDYLYSGYENALYEVMSCYRWAYKTPTDSGRILVEGLPLNGIYTAVVNWIDENGKKRSQSVTTLGKSSDPIYITSDIYIEALENDYTNTLSIAARGIGTFNLECVYYSKKYDH